MFVLAGCISIPLGNKGGVIKISDSGIEYIKETEEENITKEIKLEENENEKEEEEEKEERFYTKKDAEQIDGPVAETEIEDEYICEDDDYTEFTQHLSTDIYIPSCSILVTVTDKSEGVTGTFVVDHYDYDTVLSNYRAFLGPLREELLDTDLIEGFEELNVGRQIVINGRSADGRKISIILGEDAAHLVLMITYK